MSRVISDARTQRDRFFYRSAILMAALVLLSFPLTYFLPLLRGSHSFQLLHHAHGLVCFAWMGLLVWQTGLLAKGQVARHRAIGLVGLLLSGGLIVSGYWMAQRAGEKRLAQGNPQPWEFTWYNLVDISLFALLVIGAILLVTRHREWHRRLMYVAAICLVAPAMTRWTLKLPLGSPLLVDLLAYVLVTIPFLLALALHDRRATGRIHPATLACVAVVLPMQLSAPWVARTEAWNRVATSLLGS
jgi:hypothetical protein